MAQTTEQILEELDSKLVFENDKCRIEELLGVHYRMNKLEEEVTIILSSRTNLGKIIYKNAI